MAIERDAAYDQIAPDDIGEIFDELGLKRPDPMWYVGRLDQRGVDGGLEPNSNGREPEPPATPAVPG